MELLPPQIYNLLGAAFIGLLLFVLFLNVFGLPANWLILGVAGLWQWLLPSVWRAGILFWLILVALALIGEALELLLQVLKARKYGSSSSGTFMGMVGAIAGAILLAPLFWGLGAFIGALAGAWLGCFLMELLKGRQLQDALHSAFGTFMGRFLGTVCKTGAGAVMIAVISRQFWANAPQAPEAVEAVLRLLGSGLGAC